jgi:hypothetical protein
MGKQLIGRLSGEAAAPEASRLAEGLIREEFGEPTSMFAGTSEVPFVAPATPTRAAGAAIHEEFADPGRPSQSRSHRTGMLAGLGVVGALVAVLVLFSPGSSKPLLPEQSVHDVSPISASGPGVAAATAPTTTAVPVVTPSTPSTSTPTTQAHQTVTAPSTLTYVNLPATTTAQTPTTSSPAPTPAPTPTTAASPPPTTTTTTPPTTTPTTHCLLGLLCN